MCSYYLITFVPGRASRLSFVNHWYSQHISILLPLLFVRNKQSAARQRGASLANILGLCMSRMECLTISEAETGQALTKLLRGEWPNPWRCPFLSNIRSHVPTADALLSLSPQAQEPPSGNCLETARQGKMYMNSRIRRLRLTDDRLQRLRDGFYSSL